MGIMSRGQDNMAELVYTKIKSNLVNDDNYIHVVMINNFSKIANQGFDVDNKYNTEINSILTSMQNDGFEILDVKINSIPEQGMTGTRTAFNTLITYKNIGKTKSENRDKMFKEFEV